MVMRLMAMSSMNQHGTAWNSMKQHHGHEPHGHECSMAMRSIAMSSMEQHETVWSSSTKKNGQTGD